jgi:hypothetical protein
LPGLQSAAEHKEVDLKFNVGDSLHVECRKKFTKRPRPSSSVVGTPSASPTPGSSRANLAPAMRLRAKCGDKVPEFDDGTCCLLCGLKIDRIGRIRGVVHSVMTYRFEERLRNTIAVTRKPCDEWSQKVSFICSRFQVPFIMIYYKK